MRRGQGRGAALLLALALGGCAGPAVHVGAAASCRLPLADATPAQAAQVDEALELLASLAPQALVVAPALYARTTTFERLFGFALDGPRLCEWVRARVDGLRVIAATPAALWSAREVGLGADFFAATPAERVYALVHEARHADGPGHVPCPADFPFVSARQPGVVLAGAEACDATADGAYGFQAALLFEIHAYGLLDPVQAGLSYNSTRVRVLGR